MEAYSEPRPCARLVKQHVLVKGTLHDGKADATGRRMARRQNFPLRTTKKPALGIAIWAVVGLELLCLRGGLVMEVIKGGTVDWRRDEGFAPKTEKRGSVLSAPICRVTKNFNSEHKPPPPPPPRVVRSTIRV